MHILWCLFWGVLVAGVNVDAQCNKYSNGCVVDDSVPYKTEFTPACDRVTVCYGCGSNGGITKLRCDDAFLSDMQKICRDRNLPSDCLTTANYYYNWLRTLGGAYYKTTPESFCSETWVTSCLP